MAKIIKSLEFSSSKMKIKKSQEGNKSKVWTLIQNLKFSNTNIITRISKTQTFAYFLLSVKYPQKSAKTKKLATKNPESNKITQKLPKITLRWWTNSLKIPKNSSSISQKLTKMFKNKTNLKNFFEKSQTKNTRIQI